MARQDQPALQWWEELSQTSGLRMSEWFLTVVLYPLVSYRFPRRGVPMAVFSIAAMSATGLGPVAAGWIAMDKDLEWRWIQWIHMM